MSVVAAKQFYVVSGHSRVCLVRPSVSGTYASCWHTVANLAEASKGSRNYLRNIGIHNTLQTAVAMQRSTHKRNEQDVNVAVFVEASCKRWKCTRNA
jgi:hypothetical protein